MNHLNKFLKLVLNNSEDNWIWPKNWSESDKHKFIDDALQYLETQEMYEECKKLYEFKKEI